MEGILSITMLAVGVVGFILFLKMAYDLGYILRELQKQTRKLNDIDDALDKQSKMSQKTD